MLRNADRMLRNAREYQSTKTKLHVKKCIVAKTKLHVKSEINNLICICILSHLYIGHWKRVVMYSEFNALNLLRCPLSRSTDSAFRR